MVEDYALFHIEYDRVHKRWKIQLDEMAVYCESESEAKMICTIPYLCKKLTGRPFPSGGALFQKLRRAVELIKKYQISFPDSRELEAIYEGIVAKK